MENYLFHYDKWLVHYNCSFFNINQVPLSERQHPVIGGCILVLSVIFEFLYIPCFLSINKHSHYPCYNIMRFMSILDILVIFINGIFTGLGLCFGWVYCSYPRLIFFMGSIVTSLWAAVALSSLILAFNRCVEIISSELGKQLFSGKRVYIWEIVPIIYGFYFFWFEKPALLSAALCAWFFNPFVIYYEDYNNYINNMHSFNNMMVTFGLPLMYIFFAIVLTIQMSLTQNPSSQTRSTKKQYKTFIQVLVINSVNVAGCSIYVYMQFFSVNVYVVVCGSYAWLLIHGLPSIIYLSLNKTVRNDCKMMFNLATSKIENGLL